MKDVAATLRRIDEQITGYNQQIARARVEIARLQETRLVLSGLAEEDVILAEQAKQEARGVINGSHARPVLIVRKVGTGDEEGSASKAAKLGLSVNKNGDRRGMNNPRKKERTTAPKPRRTAAEIPPEEKQEYLRERVVTVLQSYGHGMDTGDIRKALGMHKEWHKSRKVKALYNAISYLRREGKVVQDPKDFTLTLSSAH